MDDDQLALGCKYYIQLRLDTIHRQRPDFNKKMIKIKLIHTYYHESTEQKRINLTTTAIQNNVQASEKFKKKVKEQQHADIHAPLYDAGVINQGYINEYFCEISDDEKSIRILLERVILTREERRRGLTEIDQQNE
jgi:hypothetical protein